MILFLSIIEFKWCGTKNGSIGMGGTTKTTSSLFSIHYKPARGILSAPMRLHAAAAAAIMNQSVFNRRRGRATCRH